jgi:hypothetical protein
VTLIVENLAAVQRAFAKADRDVRLGFRAELRNVAEPVRSDIESVAPLVIRNLPRSPGWSRMRTGVTRREVYVVPRLKGVRGRGPARRPNFSRLMLYRAMRPAMLRHQAEIVRRFDEGLDRMAANFNRS